MFCKRITVLFALLFSLTLVGCSGKTVEESKTLKSTFANHNLKAGTCVSGAMISDEEQRQVLLDNFSSITMENVMKPEAILDKNKSIETGEIAVEFNDEALSILEFAKENNLSMRGHTLVWYSQTPSWIFYEDFDESKNLVTRDEMLERMETFIRKTFGLIDELGYTDLFYAYDVVNEAVMEDGRMRDCLWKDTIGDDYVWYAFYYANKYAPESIDLYYNDYNEQLKTSALIRFAETLVDENGNYLVDGIGLQAHLYTQDSLITYFKTFDKLSAAGFKVEITELDVGLGSWNNPLEPTEENLKKQGDFYCALLKEVFKRVDEGTLNMDAVTFWGFMDTASWRSEYHPLLFDDTLSPKIAYDRIVNDLYDVAE